MNSFDETNASRQAQDYANKAADKAKSGIDKASANISETVESVRQQSKPILNQVGTAAKKVRDRATDASDSLVSYTRDNPVMALMMAAAAGAVFLTVMRALTPSRD